MASKVDEYKKSKRQAREVRVVKAENGKHGEPSGYVTHTEYDPETENKGILMDRGKPEMHVHKSLNSVHQHMKDCLG